MRRKISPGVDGGLSGGSSGLRPEIIVAIKNVYKLIFNNQHPNSRTTFDMDFCTLVSFLINRIRGKFKLYRLSFAIDQSTQSPNPQNSAEEMCSE